MPELLLTPVTPCPMCGTAVPRRPGRGRPRVYCSPACTREARTLAEAERRAARDLALLADDEYIPGLDRLGDWTANEFEATSHARDLHGPGASLWSEYVPDEWRTLSRDDVDGVYPGDEVGQTSPRKLCVLGAKDRPHGWDRVAKNSR